MAWPLVIPVQITFVTFAGIVLLATIAAPAFRWNRKLAFKWTAIPAIFAFFPTCLGVMTVLDQYRFGLFTYPDFESVNDFRVQRYLPQPATDITIEKRMNSFRAKFIISKPALDEWFDEHCDRAAEYQVTGGYSSGSSREMTQEDFDLWYGGLNWQAPSEYVEYDGPRESDGAGFTIWYCESEGIAYQRAGYW